MSHDSGTRLTLRGTAPVSIDSPDLQLAGVTATQDEATIALLTIEGEPADPGAHIVLNQGEVVTRSEASYLLCEVELIPVQDKAPVPPGTVGFVLQLAVSEPGSDLAC